MTALERAWQEVARAWDVAASIHLTWAKNRDAVFTTRQADLLKHAHDARALAGKPEDLTLLEQYDLEQLPGYRQGYEQGRLIGYEVGYRQGQEHTQLAADIKRKKG